MNEQPDKLDHQGSDAAGGDDPLGLRGALVAHGLGMRPIPLRPAGSTFMRDGAAVTATGKEPRVGESWPHWGARLTAAELRAAWADFPDAGVGVVLGWYDERDRRDPFERGFLALDVDDPVAARPALERIFPAGLETLRWNTTRGFQLMFLMDHDVKTALHDIVGNRAKIANDRAYPGMEILVGALSRFGKAAYTVFPPTVTLGKDGTPGSRRVMRGLAPVRVPETLLADLRKHSRVAREVSEAREAAVQEPSYQPLPWFKLKGLTPLQKVLTQLKALHQRYRPTESYTGREEYVALCPVCGREKLYVSEGYDLYGRRNGNATVHCFVCDGPDDSWKREILEALGLSFRDLFPEDEEIRRLAVQYHTSGVRLTYVGDPDPRVQDEVIRQAIENEHWEAYKAVLKQPEHLERLSLALGGIPVAALEALGAGYRHANRLKVQDDPEHWIDRGPAWTFPMVDGREKTIGLQRRFQNRQYPKTSLRGSRNGLFVPAGWRERTGPIYMPEGASDTAALWAMGLRAIGRPSRVGGERYAAELLADVDAPIVVVGERDMQPEEGRWPGNPEPFAANLRGRLPRRQITTILPKEPYKDMREYYRATRPGEARP
jgi:hypothetical protein